LHLRIEKVLVDASSKEQNSASSENEMGTGDEKVYRLFLSDGVLVVQALLQSRLVELISLGDIIVGNTVALKKFKIKRATRLNGQGEVVFLGIADCDIVRLGRNTQQAKREKISSASVDLGQDQLEGNVHVKMAKLVTSSAGGSYERRKARKRPAEQITTTQDSDSDDFETLTVDCDMIDRRRKALYDMNVNRSFESQKSITSRASKKAASSPDRQQKRFNSTTNQSSVTQITNPSSPDPRLPHPAYPSCPEQRHCQRPNAKITTTTSPSHDPLAPIPPPHHPQQTQPTQKANTQPQPPPSLPLPLPTITTPSSRPEPPHHTLLSLLSPAPTSSPLPPKNYPCTILAIISWISPTLIPPRPHSPFPPKRHIKIHDPSITSRHSGVTVAVFCDAKHFRPETGTAGLFRGVVMQRTVGGDVILNAYERLMREEGVAGRMGRWFEDEAAVLEGLGWDVVGMKRWWEERKRLRGVKKNR
jgi:hypothetical protein